MKSAEYVAAATSLYREAVDRAWNDDSTRAGKAGAGPAIERLADRARRVFSRGESEGFLGGIDHQSLVDGRTRSHRGIRFGAVSRFGRDFVEVDLRAGAPSLSPGDGVLLAAGPAEEDETGGKILAVERLPGPLPRLRIRFVRGLAPQLARLANGCAVYLTHDHKTQADLRRLFKDPNARKRIPLSLAVSGSAGRPLIASYTDPEGRETCAHSEVPLDAAARHPLDEEVLSAHLGRLGDTRYRVRSISVRIDGSLALPVSEMNRMRRTAITELEKLRAAPPGPRDPGESGLTHGNEPVIPSPILDAVSRAESGIEPGAEVEASRDRAPVPTAPTDPFILLCRNATHVAAALHAGASRIVLDFLDLAGLKEAAASVRAAGAELTLALPRIQKPGEERIWDFFLARRPDAILVRNLASLERLSQFQRRSDPDRRRLPECGQSRCDPPAARRRMRTRDAGFRSERGAAPRVARRSRRRPCGGSSSRTPPRLSHRTLRVRGVLERRRRLEDLWPAVRPACASSSRPDRRGTCRHRRRRMQEHGIRRAPAEHRPAAAGACGPAASLT